MTLIVNLKQPLGCCGHFAPCTKFNLGTKLFCSLMKDGCVEKVCQGKQVCERAEAVLEERGGKLWGSVSVFLAAILGRPVELQVMR